jgi:hypothetical protein
MHGLTEKPNHILFGFFFIIKSDLLNKKGANLYKARQNRLLPNQNKWRPVIRVGIFSFINHL